MWQSTFLGFFGKKNLLPKKELFSKNGNKNYQYEGIKIVDICRWILYKDI